MLQLLWDMHWAALCWVIALSCVYEWLNELWAVWGWDTLLGFAHDRLIDWLIVSFERCNVGPAKIYTAKCLLGFLSLTWCFWWLHVWLWKVFDRTAAKPNARKPWNRGICLARSFHMDNRARRTGRGQVERFRQASASAAMEQISWKALT